MNSIHRSIFLLFCFFFVVNGYFRGYTATIKSLTSSDRIVDMNENAKDRQEIA